MSCDRDSEFSDITSEKPLKRVRFSDEIESVFEYEYDENDENISLENGNDPFSSELPNTEHSADEFSTDGSMMKLVDSDTVQDCARSDESVPECCDDKVDELIECNEQVVVTDNSFKTDCKLENGETSKHFPSNDSPIEYFDNNNSNMLDLNLLIRETEHMTISSSKQTQFGLCSSCDSKSEKIDYGNWIDIADVYEHKKLKYKLLQKKEISPFNIDFKKNGLQVAPQSVEQNSGVSSVTRKRSSQGTLIERQTSKLNTCLKNENSEVKSAVDIKNAVFNAWNKVKTESAKNENTLVVPEINRKIICALKASDKKSENRKDVRLKSSKRNAKKASFKDSEPVIQKKKADTEENKMAFRAWKKKKDELLNQQIAEKHKKEEKKRLDAIMNERMRKSDAESAYLAWISHKAAVVKMERRKSQWLLERENEKLNERLKRNDEAAKMYYKWLRSKIFSKNNSYHMITEDKPPWTPPGKANSLT